MNGIDLFAGIGGLSLGFQKAGIETVCFCESDEPCQRVIKKHWPKVPICEDVKLLTLKWLIKHGINSVDIVFGGFPCQDVSVAGQKKGFQDEKDILQDFEREFEVCLTTGLLEDVSKGDLSELCERIAKAGGKNKASTTRSGLWKEFLRVIKEVRPRYAVIENVANLRNLGLAQVIQDLWSIGYACEWHIISARSVGAPHLRERIWIVAYPSSERRQQESRGAYENEKKDGEKKDHISQCHGQSNGPGQIQGDVADASNSDSNRPQEGLLLQARDQREGAFPGGSCSSRTVTFFPANSNMPRLWQPFASEEEKSEWWSEATARFRDWWEIESSICRVDDGLSPGLDKARRERVKQLGNSVVPFIPELIGRAIMDYEARALKGVA